MLKMLFETGHPWITFKDPCNVRSPQDHGGVIHRSNLCTEITLNTSDDETAVCNLGSVILDTHIRDDGSLDHEMLRETITVAVRALDNVIDINFYPTEAARPPTSATAPSASASWVCRTPSSRRASLSPIARRSSSMTSSWRPVAYYAYSASSDLAAERGTYASYRGSKWDRGLLPQDTIELLEKERGIKIDVPRGGRMDWNPVRDKIRKHGMRNSNVLAIAPTATISNIMGTTPCIEPNYKNLYVKSNLVRRLHRSQSRAGPRPQEGRPLERGNARPAQVLRRRAQGRRIDSRSISSESTSPCFRWAMTRSSTPPPAARSGSTSHNP